MFCSSKAILEDWTKRRRIIPGNIYLLIRKPRAADLSIAGNNITILHSRPDYLSIVRLCIQTYCSIPVGDQQSQKAAIMTSCKDWLTPNCDCRAEIPCQPRKFCTSCCTGDSSWSYQSLHCQDLQSDNHHQVSYPSIYCCLQYQTTHSGYCGPIIFIPLPCLK